MSVRWRASVYLNLFHWPTGKDFGNCNGVCRYVQAVINLIFIGSIAMTRMMHKLMLNGLSKVNGLGKQITLKANTLIACFWIGDTFKTMTHMFTALQTIIPKVGHKLMDLLQITV